MKHAIATINAKGGIAVVSEPDGRVYIFDVRKEGIQDGVGVHLGMLLQPAMNNLEERPAGEYPYEETAVYLHLAHRQQRALYQLLACIDARLPRSLRRTQAEHAEELLADDAVRDRVREICLTAPLPSAANPACKPLTGRVSEIITEMFAKWQPVTA